MRMATATFLVLAATSAAADIIRLENGGTLEGVVLRETPTSLVIRLKYATVTLDRSEIAAVEKKAPDESPVGAPDRLPRWDRALDVVAPRPWAAELRQIPATVIDRGVFRHIPYMSHKSGDWEFNLYGDPDRPAAIEIGVYKELRRSNEARRECLETLAALLKDPGDVEILRSLRPEADRKERAGLTFEVTPETAEDAYDGWWVSVYDTRELNAARATEEELKQITVAEEDLKEEGKKAPPLKETREKRRTIAQTESRKPTPSPSTTDLPPQEVLYIMWRPRELKQARPASQAKKAGGGGRRVFLRGIHRKGGLYVRPGAPQPVRK